MSARNYARVLGRKRAKCGGMWGMPTKPGKSAVNRFGFGREWTRAGDNRTVRHDGAGDKEVITHKACLAEIKNFIYTLHAAFVE
jgi:hypothetical protein